MRDKTMTTETSEATVVKDKVLVYYHDNCIDGYTSAWAARRGLIINRGVSANNISCIPIEYQSISFLELEANTDVDAIYFVDFSVPADTLVILASKVNDVYVLDHHKTAYGLYSKWGFDVEKNPVMSGSIGNIHIFLDLYESGASLTWKFFFTNSYGGLPLLVKFVKDYDLWKFSLPDTKVINMYLRVTPKTFEDWNKLFAALSDPAEMYNIVKQGEAIQDYHDMLVQDYVDQAEPCDIDGEIGLVVNCSGHFASDVGGALAIKSGTYGATWQQDINNRVKWSLRSRGYYDVSKLAEKFGGGGHKNAAGFVMSNPETDFELKGIKLWSAKQD